MTSGELLNKRFEKARMGGYKTTEVEAFLAEAATAFAELTRANTDLKRQIEALRAQTEDVEADKNSLRDALLSAQKFADSLVQDAKGQADTLLADAREKADRLTSSVQIQVTQEKEELARIKKEVSAFRSRLLETYRAHLELIGAIPVEKTDASGESRPQPAAVPPENAAEPSETPGAPEQPSPAESDTPEDTTREQAAAVEAPVGPAEKIKAEQKPQQAPKPASGSAVRLNMRYDERTGEYVPIAADDSQDKK